jgi:hypothetical protein
MPPCLECCLLADWICTGQSPDVWPEVIRWIQDNQGIRVADNSLDYDPQAAAGVVPGTFQPRHALDSAPKLQRSYALNANDLLCYATADPERTNPYLHDNER